MSQSPTAVSRTNRGTEAENRVLTTDDDVEPLLGALTDADCRAILEAVSHGEETLSATELSDACEVPLSTTYRKLDRLTDAGLLEERLRIHRSGKHVTEYAAAVDDVHISVDSDAGVALYVSRSTGIDDRGAPVLEGW